MSKSARGALCALVVLLAGCASGPRQEMARAPDWEDLGRTPSPLPLPAAPTSPLTAPPPPPAVNSPPLAVNSPKAAVETWVPLRRWCQANGLAAPTQLGTAPQPTYALHSGNGTFILRAGSQLARWDGLEVHLGFAPQCIDHQPYLHALDLQKTVLPLLDGTPILTRNAAPVVVIDPGHGGTDAGARSVLGSHYEKDYTLDWARRLQVLLATNGWSVFLTRSNDVDLALSNRVAVAEEHKAGLFVSLHFNSAAPDAIQAGLETYCLTPAGVPSNLTRGFADDLACAFPNNTFDAQNLRFALRVHRALLQVNGQHDRGVRRARFPRVLRDQVCPAILVEGGYLSNPREAARIADPAYRQKLAEAVARALLQEL